MYKATNVLLHFNIFELVVHPISLSRPTFRIEVFLYNIEKQLKSCTS